MTYNKIRILDHESTKRILKFFKQRYSENSIEEAWLEFGSAEERPSDLSAPAGDSFRRWLLFSWRPGEDTIAEQYLLENKTNVPADLKDFVFATIAAEYSFFQVIDADPGRSLTLRDVLRKCEFHVIERSASTILNRGHIIYARIAEMYGIFFFMGCGSLCMQPRILDQIISYRTYWEKTFTQDGVITEETLFQLEEELRELYFKIEYQMLNPAMVMQNTDGDSLVLHTLTYSIPSADAAFHALKDLEQKCTGLTDEQMLADASRDESGTLTDAVIRWVKKVKQEVIGEYTSMGTITITPRQLVVEVNSKNRSKQIQREIQQRLGDSAVLTSSDIHASDEILQQARSNTNAGCEQQDDDQEALLLNNPDLKGMVTELMQNYLKTWIDTPIPALRNKTPRQAAKNPAGRELLESLLMDIEMMNQQQKQEILRTDVGKLRKELGMEM